MNHRIVVHTTGYQMLILFIHLLYQDMLDGSGIRFCTFLTMGTDTSQQAVKSFFYHVFRNLVVLTRGRSSGTLGIDIPWRSTSVSA